MAKRGSKLAQKSKKNGISKAKKDNIRKMKMAKRGDKTDGQKKRKKEDKKAVKKETYIEAMKQKSKRQKKREIYDAPEVYPLVAEVTGDEMMNMMDPEDLSYLVETRGKKRKRKDEEPDIEKEERDYNKDKLPDNMRRLLPIKTADGQFVRRYTDKISTENGEDDSSSEEETDDDEKEKEEDVKDKEKTTVDFLAERQAKLEDRKVRIGCLAANFIQMPQERLSALTSLLEYMDEADPDVKVTVKKYAALSLLQAFHRTIPTYKIKIQDDTIRLKKGTRELWFYESHLLTGYQNYLKGLEAMVSTVHTRKARNPIQKSMCLIGVQCLGELLTQHSHFNFTQNLIQAITPLLNHPDDQICKLVSSYIFKLFKTDSVGDLSLEVVRRIDQVVRRRAFRVRPEVIAVLLGLKMRGVTSLDSIIQEKRNSTRKLTHKEKLLRKVMEEKKAKKGKKESKMIRKQRKLEEDMKHIHKEAKSRVINKHHAAIIQTVFGIYVHVLKRRPNNKLNATVLEGLARFAHLVNIEYFADLLSTLGALMREGSLRMRESLHCIQVVFTILAGQGQILTLDPTAFYQYLYANMFNINAADNHDDIVTVVESLRQMLVERGSRAGQVRVLSFSKRLATQSLTLLHSGVIAALAILRAIMLTHKITEGLLEVDSEGSSGVYQAEVNDPQLCNPGSTSLWELHILKRHYHGTVQQMSQHLMHGVPLQGAFTLPFTLTKRPTDELYKSFSPSEMSFNPAIPAPGHHLQGHAKRLLNNKKKNLKQDWTTQYMATAAEDVGQQYRYNTNTGTGQYTDEKLVGADFHSGMLASMDFDKIPEPAAGAEEDYPDCTSSLIHLEKEP